jgi:gamma-glutamylaminecyclotransferase
MILVFVYGSLKQGFVNAGIHRGSRVEGDYRTQQPHPMYLLGDGEVPCIVASPGSGYQVIGELYRVAEEDVARMDRLERLGDPDGYERVTIDLERFDVEPGQHLSAFVYVKREHAIPADARRVGPLAEYRPEHAGNFRWKGLG